MKMAKTYDFVIVINEASFEHGSQAIVFGGSDTVFKHEVFEGTLKAAQALVEQYVQAETRDCAGWIRMKYRDDRCPPGFKKLRPVFSEQKVAA